MDGLWAYFQGEKQAGLVCFVIGAVAAGIATGIWQGGGRFRAGGITVGLVALAQLVVGMKLLLGTDGRVKALIQPFDQNFAGAVAAESARMVGVMRAFTIIELVEVVLIAGGVMAAIRFRTRPAVVAAVLGLALQCAVMLTFDLRAEARARTYLSWLKGAH